MSEVFLFYKLTITPGWSMSYLHLLIGLISSKKYRRAAKNLIFRFKKANLSKTLFLWNPYKNPNKRRETESSKNKKKLLI